MGNDRTESLDDRRTRRSVLRTAGAVGGLVGGFAPGIGSARAESTGTKQPGDGSTDDGLPDEAGPRGYYQGTGLVSVNYGSDVQEAELPAAVFLADPMSTTYGTATYSEYNPFSILVAVTNLEDQSGRSTVGDTWVYSAGASSSGLLYQYWDLQYDAATATVSGTLTDPHYNVGAAANVIYAVWPIIDMTLPYLLLDGTTLEGAITDTGLHLRISGRAWDGTELDPSRGGGIIGFDIDVVATKSEEPEEPLTDVRPGGGRRSARRRPETGRE